MDYSLFFGLIIGSGIPAAIIGIPLGIAWIVRPLEFRREHELTFLVAGLCWAACVFVLIVALGIGQYLSINYRPS